MKSPYEPCADSWLAMWDCATVWSLASMEAIGRLWGLTSSPGGSRGDALAQWSLVLDRQMRTPSFLRLLRYGVQVASARSWFDLAHSVFGSPVSLLARRASP